MILATLAGAEPYVALGPGISLAIQYLRTFRPETPDGRHDVLGDTVFALVSTYETGPASERRFEAHHDHLDVQYVAEGEERILHAPVNTLGGETFYSAEKDTGFFADPKVCSSLLLRPGEMAIFGPEDAHKPGCMAGARTRVKKVVVKVRI